MSELSSQSYSILTNASVLEAVTDISLSTHSGVEAVVVGTSTLSSDLLLELNEGLISARARDLVEMVLGCVLMHLASYLGIPGNVISMVVFAKQGLRDRVNLLLFSLALVDVTYLLTYLAVRAPCYLQNTDPLTVQNWRTVMLPNVWQFNLFTLHLSIYLGTLLAVDRCVSVCLPLKAGSILTFRRMLGVIVFLSASTFSVYLPTFFYSTAVWIPDPTGATSREVAVMKLSQFFINNQSYHSFEQNFIRILDMVCLGIIVVCSTATVISLRRASSARSEMSENKLSNAEKKITKMLLCVSLILAISITPSFVGVIATMFEPEFFFFKRYHNLAMVNARVIYFAAGVNSSINFYLYVAMSSKFRATFLTLCRCCRHNDSSKMTSQPAGTLVTTT